LMGGRMWAESNGVAGDGTTFYFTVDVGANDENHVNKANSLSPALPLHELIHELKGKAILLVEDNASSRFALTKQLEAWGMVVHTATSSDEALAFLETKTNIVPPLEAAILDMGMPDMDGVHLARLIHQQERWRALPLLLLNSIGVSANSHQGQALESDHDLFAAILTKPCKTAHLAYALSRVLGKQTTSAPKLVGELPIAPSGTAARPLRILLAEDNVVNQKVALLILRKLGYEADVAADGLEVLDALQRQPYDLILMDIQMPEMDGFETTRQIRRTLSFPQQPHIVAMTAHAMQGDRAQCLAAGMDDYISKPMRAQDLLTVLNTLTIV
jgi:CheY-like chemotaxis protein